MTNGRLDVAFIVRFVLAALLIYFAVWQDSKVALAIVLGAMTIAIEVIAFTVNDIWRR